MRWTNGTGHCTASVNHGQVAEERGKMNCVEFRGSSTSTNAFMVMLANTQRQNCT